MKVAIILGAVLIVSVGIVALTIAGETEAVKMLLQAIIDGLMAALRG